MTDDNPKDQSNHPGNTTHDLRGAAEEALRMLREAKNQSAKTVQSPNISSTTNDVSREAQAALDKYQAEQRARAQQAQTRGEPTFEKDQVVHLRLSELLKPLVIDVKREMIIGRGDNTSTYQPDIDLTKYGAYRLGLSRRHATLRRSGQQLEVIDLDSRNGTYINGDPISPLQPHKLHDGDELRLANMAMRISFQPKETDS